MKKLNRKGFTLVELLAVIIILALVVGITIPVVLTTSNGAKRSVFKSSADSLAEWVKGQYDAISLAGLGTEVSLTPEFKTLCGDDGTKCVVTATTAGENTKTLRANANADFLTAAGLKPKNYYEFVVAIDGTTGVVCVKMSMSNDGDYYYGSVGNDAFISTTSCSLTKFSDDSKPIGKLSEPIGAYAA